MRGTTGHFWPGAGASHGQPGAMAARKGKLGAMATKRKTKARPKRRKTQAEVELGEAFLASELRTLSKLRMIRDFCDLEMARFLDAPFESKPFSESDLQRIDAMRELIIANGVRGEQVEIVALYRFTLMALHRLDEIQAEPEFAPGGPFAAFGVETDDDFRVAYIQWQHGFSGYHTLHRDGVRALLAAFRRTTVHNGRLEELRKLVRWEVPSSTEQKCLKIAKATYKSEKILPIDLAAKRRNESPT